MDIDDTPVLDNHLHLDPVNGRNVAAAQEFADHGGTHLLVLNKPSWHLVEAATEEATFREAFDLTVEAAADASAVLDGRAWPVLGVHPALISKLVDDGYTPPEARDIMQTGLDAPAVDRIQVQVVVQHRRVVDVHVRLTGGHDKSRSRSATRRRPAARARRGRRSAARPSARARRGPGRRL